MKTINYQYENKLIFKSGIKYIIPAMLALLFGQIAPLVDAVCVSGGLGEEALSSLSTVAPVFYFFNIIGALGGAGCGVNISRCSGSGEKDKASRMFTIAVIFMLAASIILTVLAFIFIDPLLWFLRATPENFGYAKEYLIIILCGAPFMVFSFAGDIILPSDNNPNLAMIATGIGAIANVIIDVVGIYVFHQGIWVAAFGTAFGAFVATAIFLLNFRRKDSLCRINPPKKDGNNPSFSEIVKPGTPQAIMYFFTATQIFIQNYVLSDGGGTSGLGNSAVIDNLELVLTIFVAGASDAVLPLAASYFGEKNKSGMLMVKRTLMHIGLCIFAPIFVVLVFFPNLFIACFSVKDPVMLSTLPLAVRIMTISFAINFVNDHLINYLTAIEKENRANIAFVIRFAILVPLALLLAGKFPMDAPWYATIVADIFTLIYLLFFCRMTRGLMKRYPENSLLMTGGYANHEDIAKWQNDAAKILTEAQLNTVNEKLFTPFEENIPNGKPILCAFTILDKGSDEKSVILRYDYKTDFIDDGTNKAEPDEEQMENIYNECIRSEFNSMRRMMINFKGKEV